MRPIDADPIIKNLSVMKTQLGYDAIDIDGMIKALRETEEVVVAQLPNDPLTLDELREMDGEPVWVEHYNGGEWVIVSWNIYDEIAYTRKARLSAYNYGLSDSPGWIAYLRKPEEAT